MAAQLQLEFLATAAGTRALSVINGYIIKQVTERRCAIYDPAGRFVCHIGSSDTPGDVIAIDQAHQARQVTNRGDGRLSLPTAR